MIINQDVMYDEIISIKDISSSFLNSVCYLYLNNKYLCEFDDNLFCNILNSFDMFSYINKADYQSMILCNDMKKYSSSNDFSYISIYDEYNDICYLSRYNFEFYYNKIKYNSDFIIIGIHALIFIFLKHYVPLYCSIDEKNNIDVFFVIKFHLNSSPKIYIQCSKDIKHFNDECSDTENIIYIKCNMDIHKCKSIENGLILSNRHGSDNAFNNKSFIQNFLSKKRRFLQNIIDKYFHNKSTDNIKFILNNESELDSCASYVAHMCKFNKVFHYRYQYIFNALQKELKLRLYVNNMGI